MSTWKIKRNDTAPAITKSLVDADGAVVDLTGATVAVLMRDTLDSALKINLAAATVVTPATGAVSYQWVTGDTDTAGLFELEWVVTFAGGTKRSLPATTYDRVMIYGDLDDV